MFRNFTFVIFYLSQLKNSTNYNRLISCQEIFPINSSPSFNLLWNIIDLNHRHLTYDSIWLAFSIFILKVLPNFPSHYKPPYKKRTCFTYPYTNLQTGSFNSELISTKLFFQYINFLSSSSSIKVASFLYC